MSFIKLTRSIHTKSLEPLNEIFHDSLFEKDRLHLELRTFGKLLHSDATPCRRLLCRKVARIDLIDTGEVAHIGKEDSVLDYIIQGEFIGLCQSLQVYKRLFSLADSIIAYKVTR